MNFADFVIWPFTSKHPYCRSIKKLTVNESICKQPVFFFFDKKVLFGARFKVCMILVYMLVNIFLKR